MENFDPKEPSKGVGDSIAKLTHALGIDKLADKVAKALGEEDCGCDRRREKLNELFPYNEPDIPKEQYIFLKPRLFEVQKQIMHGDDKGGIIEYKPGEKVFIDPTHKLYPTLKYHISNKTLKQVD